MSITLEEFKAEFRAAQEAVIHEHGDEHGHVPSLCKVMHRDLGLTETRADDADELAEQAAYLTGENVADINTDDIDFTEEHKTLHRVLKSVVLESLIAGAGTEQLAATMFVIGRRYGMREAARLLNESPTSDDSPEVQA